MTNIRQQLFMQPVVQTRWGARNTFQGHEAGTFRKLHLKLQKILIILWKTDASVIKTFGSFLNQ